MHKVLVPFKIDDPHGRVVVGGAEDGTAHVLHCSYYNNYLLRTIWKDAAEFVDSVSIIVGAAAEQAYVELKKLFDCQSILRIESRKEFASEFYSWQGFGLLDLAAIDPEGGLARSDSQHYVEGWKEQFGVSDEPIGLMTQGWLAGAASAIYDLPQGHFSVRQLACAACAGQTASVFELRPGKPGYALFASKADRQHSNAVELSDERTGNVDASSVAKAVAMLPLFGSTDRDKGLINNFDVLLTWHPHRYYDRISQECVRQATAQFGEEGRLAVEPLLEEAGHRCAFRTFGGIWRSPEWEAFVEPMCVTREDWIHGMIAIINCMGWGHVRCEKISPEEAIFVVHDDYESVGCLSLYDEISCSPVYLLKGGFRGMMNLIYNEHVQTKPALTEAFYERMCRRKNAYETTVERCVALGDAVTVLRVTRKTADAHGADDSPDR